MIAGCQVGGGDLLIKLFGKTIPVPESCDAKDLQQSSSNSSTSTEQDQDAHAPDNAHAHQDTPDPPPQPEVVDAEDPAAKSSPDQTHQKPGHGDGAGDVDAASQREKLRKPDKILPCPRCSSMDTKFCYFNNYNVNQPRHFCKNCQRYWTAGGAMRNVPVGAGRRKNKNAAAAAAAASHFLLHRVRACGGGVGGDTLRSTTTNGTVLSFGGGHGGAPPQCLDLAEQLGHHLAPPASARNAGGNPAGPACSEGSSSRDGNNDSRSCVDEAGAANGDGLGSVSVQQQHPAAVSVNGMWPPPPPYSCAPSPPAAYFSSGIAIPMIYPAAPGYWGCMVPPGVWSLPWPVPQQPPTSSSSPTTTAASAPSVSSSGAADAHTMGLGKHPRDREGDDGGRNGGGNGKVWAPKTIRIDDVDEVARSSIWSLIGIRGDKNSKQQDAADGAAGGHKQQLGTVFEPKRGEASKKQQAMMTSSSPLLHANPVALTRSVAFQEGSA